MAIGGDTGVEVDISLVGSNLRTDFKLFSESNARWIIEVKKEEQKNFEKLLKKEKTPFIQIGKTHGKKLVVNDNDKTVLNLDVPVLRDAWKKTLWDIMG